MGDLRRALCGGWKTWSLASPSAKLRLRDPRKTRSSCCPCEDGKGDASFRTWCHGCTSVLGLAPPKGLAPAQCGMGSFRNISPRAISFPHPTLSGALLDPGLPRRRDELATASEPADPGRRWPRTRPRRFPASDPVSLASETRLCSPTPAPIPAWSALAGPSSPSSR